MFINKFNRIFLLLLSTSTLHASAAIGDPSALNYVSGTVTVSYGYEERTVQVHGKYNGGDQICVKQSKGRFPKLGICIPVDASVLNYEPDILEIATIFDPAKLLLIKKKLNSERKVYSMPASEDSTLVFIDRWEKEAEIYGDFALYEYGIYIDFELVLTSKQNTI